MKSTIKIDRYIDGIPVYDCSIFGGNGVTFNKPVYVTGDIILGNDADIWDIHADGNVVLGDNACTNYSNISAGGDVIIGDNALIGDINSSSNVIIGNNADMWDISTYNVNIGTNADIRTIRSRGSVPSGIISDIRNVFAWEDIVIEGDLNAINIISGKNIYLSGNSIVFGKIIAKCGIITQSKVADESNTI